MKTSRRVFTGLLLTALAIPVAAWSADIGIRDAGAKIRGDAWGGWQARTHQRHARDYSQSLYYQAKTEQGVTPAEAQEHVAQVKKNVEAANKLLDQMQTANANDEAVKKSVEVIKKHHEHVLSHCDMLTAECKKAGPDGVKVCDCCLDIAKELDSAAAETDHLLKHLKADQLPAMTKTGKTAAKDGDAAPPDGIVQATFLITGLHCAPCTRTVEQGVKGMKGIKSISVDWQTKNARVTFDERLVSSQQLASTIAGTPHMMGGNMQYGGWLALKVDGVNDEATAKKAKEVLSALKGVSRVAVYPAQMSVGVAFQRDGKVASQELIAALKEAGLNARNMP